MRYLFQRIVHNDHNWTRPSAGRLESLFDKGYVSEQGFAHEDWNFSRAITTTGDAYGYCYYMPKDPSGPFCIAFATYEGSGIWSLAGLYESAEYDPHGASFESEVLLERANQLAALRKAGHIGGEYSGCTHNSAHRMHTKAQQHYRWRVKPENISQPQFSITLPSALLPKVGYHFSRPTELTEKQYKGIKRYLSTSVKQSATTDFEDGGETEFPEGAKVQKQHYRFERNPTVVKLAKNNFYKRYGRFFCEVCHFDFKESYGAIGKNFIEAHHIIPVCEMKAGSSTKAHDLIMLCSNCHRMVHKIRPWQGSLEKLKALISELRQVG